MDYLGAVEPHRLSFATFIAHLCHSYNLKSLASGYHAEIVCLVLGALACFLHFEFSTAVGATATAKCVNKCAFGMPDVTAVGASSRTIFGAVGYMLNAMLVCPFSLCR